MSSVCLCLPSSGQEPPWRMVCQSGDSLIVALQLSYGSVAVWRDENLYNGEAWVPRHQCFHGWKYHNYLNRLTWFIIHQASFLQTWLRPYLSRFHRQTEPSLAQEAMERAEVGRERMACGWKAMAPTRSLWPRKREQPGNCHCSPTPSSNSY